MKKQSFILFTLIAAFLVSFNAQSQIVNLGSGSYTKTFPGKDSAGRNEVPSGTPQISGNAIGKPIPTSDWWSALVKNGQASNLFTMPYTLKTVNQGLVTTYIPSGVIDDINPITVGVTGMAATKTTVDDYSDWTVTMNWNDGTHNFKATAGIGMPFLYFTKATTDVAQITVTSGTVTVSNEMLIVTNARNNADFAIYAPVGSTWTQNGGVYTSTLNGKNYWSMAFIPLTATSVTTVANEYKKYAYVFPTGTTANYTYNQSTSVLRTDFNVQTVVKEGTETNMLLGLLPHQWAHLASNSPIPNKYSYAVIRGEMKTLAGNSFSVENTFHGILPTLPYLDNYSTGFVPTALSQKVTSIENDQLATWTDSYNEGQVMNRLIQAARIADAMGNTASRDKMIATIKTRLENWLKTNSGEVAFLFYYDTTWTSLIGYPAGYGSDSSLNDHHFHWGYFINAAAFVEQYQPGWSANWGAMVNMVIKDSANSNRNDTMFPYLRNFNPYNGQCWADGFANNPQGNNQESSSESMMFNASLIEWGQASGDTAMRDLGIYLYSTEQTAIEEYYMDTHDRNFPPSQQYSLVSRVWGNSNDNGTFWTGDIAASYGIELYPIQGGALYLGQDTTYATKLWAEIEANTGILANQVNPNLWHDVYWQYLAFTNPTKAISLYNSFQNRDIKFGVSDAQTYHWLHAMNALGRVDASITANNPIASAFTQNGVTTYVAQNFTNAPITVHFSTGYDLIVPPHKMATSRDIAVAGVLTSSFSKASENGSVQLSVAVSGGSPTKVEFMEGSTSLGIVTTAPFTLSATSLTLGMHSFYAKIFDANQFNVTNVVTVEVGNQLPYGGTAWAIPGTIESGKYDFFEGGKGQNISYLDASVGNAANFRVDEDVDAGTDTTEGAIVGYIDGGEWLEYTVNVAQAGNYSFAFRYASGNSTGGGPFHLELDGKPISGDISVTTTSLWETWATKTISNIPFTPGKHILRLAITSGGFNIGKMTFARTANLANSYPTAVSGSTLSVALPQTSATLDGSASTESANKTLTYSWTQNYGASVLQFSNAAIANPVINGLVVGTYSLKLIVTNSDMVSDEDELLITVTDPSNTPPTVSITAPASNSNFIQGNTITITANASDANGTVQKVDFYQNNTLIGTDTSTPYSVAWSPTPGNYVLTAKATDNNGSVSISTAINTTVTANTSPTVSLTAPTNNSNTNEGATVTITANASDADGTIQKVDFYQNNTLIGTDTSAPYSITWSPAAGNYALTAKATDNGGAVSTSTTVNVSVAVKPACSTTSAIATQGSFSTGYKCDYKTTGTTVTVTFELLDTDKVGLVAYLWKETPFSEAPMTNVSGRIFSATLTNQTIGSTISYACKFAFAGGLAVTKYLPYVVGDNCTTLGIEEQTPLQQYVYPNPVHDTLTMQLQEGKNQIILTDILGQKILESNVPSDSTLDMSTFKTGIYFLKITNANSTQTIKISKK